MNSAKHLPTLVFVMGFSALVYSMYVFFFEGTSRVTEARQNPAATEVRNEIPVAKSIPLPKLPRITELDRTVEPDDTFAKEMREAARKPAEQYLAKVGLALNLPENHRFREIKDGAVDILIGTNLDGQEAFYMFTFKKKSEPSKVQKYIQSYFREEGEYKSGAGQPYRNRAGLKDLIVFKGKNSEGVDFQTYTFHDAKLGRSYALLLKEKNLSRQPAKVRLIVDSMRTRTP